MKQFNVRCPHCGTVNKRLYLEETDGWFECEKCNSSSKVEIEPIKKGTWIPVLSMKQASTLYRQQTV